MCASATLGCIMKKLQPLAEFARRRKTKTLLSVGPTKVDVFDQLEVKLLYLHTPSRPSVEISTIAMSGVQLVLISIHS